MSIGGSFQVGGLHLGGILVWKRRNAVGEIPHLHCNSRRPSGTASPFQWPQVGATGGMDEELQHCSS